jgi:hypothetical protein
MESGTMSISKEETSCLTSVVSAAVRPNNNIVSKGVFKLLPFSDDAVFLTSAYQNKCVAGKCFLAELRNAQA